MRTVRLNLASAFEYELKDLLLDYVTEVEVHGFIRVVEVFEQYLDEDTKANPTIGIFGILDTGHNLPLDHWYRKSYNFEKNMLAYTIMKSEVETIISQMTLDTKLKLGEFERDGVPLPMSYGARWWAGTTFKGKFYH